MQRNLSKWILVTMVLGFQSISAWADFPYLKVNIIQFTDANESNIAVVNGAADLIEQVVNSNAFRDRVLNMNYRLKKNGKVYPGFTQNSDTNEEILAKILRAQEIYDGGSEGVIDYYLDMYYTSRNVIGYTSPTDKFIHLNRRYYKNYTPVKATANLFHEWLHKIGFKHSKGRNKYRPHSVPYKLGYLVGEMAAEIASNHDPIQQAELRAEFMQALDEPCED